jgi:ribonuclease HII
MLSNNEMNETNIKQEKKTRKTAPQICLKSSYYDINSSNFNENIEIGVDEAGRGPMFGRVYAAAVILPKDDSFEHYRMKDSKKFHSKKKINEVAEYIKQNALHWSVQWEDEKVIDKINIRNATHSAMHKAINAIHNKEKQTLLLVDGNDFKPYLVMNGNKGLEQIEHITVEGGDNKFSAIAAASILAKVERDKYIETMCDEFPYLDERYDLNKNKGYGTKNHMDGIRKYGISQWHRQSFGLCKTANHACSFSSFNGDGQE